MEPHTQGTIVDTVGDQEMDELPDANATADEEAELLEQMALPKHSATDRERLTCWLRFRRRAHVATRRLHRNLRHLPKEALIQMLSAARTPLDYTNDAEHFRCQGCDNTKQTPQSHKVSAPRRYVFNDEVGIDVFEVLDAIGKHFSVLNSICMGTTHDQAWIVRESESLGSSYSRENLKSFVECWTRRAGWTEEHTQQRGYLARCSERKVWPPDLQHWSHQNKSEGSNDAQKDDDKGDQTHTCCRKGHYGCDLAADETSRNGGIASAQWVLSRSPRAPA